MAKPSIYNAIGLMSGTSLDGIDVALIETDGEAYAEPRGGMYIPYDEALKDRIRVLLGQTKKTPESDAVERALTLAHADAVKAFLRKENMDASDVRMIGFHGQTITHAPQDGFTWQIGDGALLARETGIDVVNNFRTADVEAGGEGAPLLPLYHYARVRSAGVTETVAILNIGGVSNVTWIGRGEDDILAFDTGPGNALIDDTMLNRTGDSFDRDGLLARQGLVHQLMIDLWMDHDFFTRVPPKSLDRNAWKIRNVDTLSTVDALATLTAFTVQANIKAKDFFPEPPAAWYVAGGGRHNPVIMQSLHMGLGVPVKSVDVLGWNGDMLEAEGFAYLAVRSALKLPLSLPTTTGVLRPLTGGMYHSASAR